MALVSGWAILGRTFCPQGSCVRSKKMDKCKDLSKFDKRQIVKDDWFRVSANMQFLWDVPSLHWSVSHKNCSKSLSYLDTLEFIILCISELIYLKLLLLVLIENCQSKQHISLLHIGLQSSQGAHVEPWLLPKAPIKGHMTNKIVTRRNGRLWSDLMNHVFFYITWLARCLHIAYLGNTWHHDAL